MLTPYATKFVSQEDKEIIETQGIAVIDCSWALFDSVKVKCNKEHERKLPLCKAANPVNYGKEYKLNCAEALAGCLYLAGFTEEAETVLNHFKYGMAFLAINEYAFDRFLECENSDQVATTEEAVKKTLKDEKEAIRN